MSCSHKQVNIIIYIKLTDIMLADLKGKKQTQNQMGLLQLSSSDTFDSIDYELWR